MTTEIRQGLVKWFDFQKRYGFVVLQDDRGEAEDAMLHVSAFIDGAKPTSIPKGSMVEVEIERTKRGLTVKKVLHLKLPESFINDDRFIPVTVKWFDEHRGYGFVTQGEGTDDIFIHAAVLKSASLVELKTNMKLLVVIEPGEKGSKVIYVKGAD